ncbi:MAG: hypothetical protein Q7W16_03410 [Coriobacteriia bacterium]|nr:hypothetical protein [Coriobacteriia bacterium]
MSSTLLVLGQRFRPFASIEDVGAIFGVTKATAYRHADREGWPLVGGNGTHKKVNLAALCERIHLSYEIEVEDREVTA